MPKRKEPHNTEQKKVEQPLQKKAKIDDEKKQQAASPLIRPEKYYMKFVELPRTQIAPHPANPLCQIVVAKQTTYVVDVDSLLNPTPLPLTNSSALPTQSLLGLNTLATVAAACAPVPVPASPTPRKK